MPASLRAKVRHAAGRPHVTLRRAQLPHSLEMDVPGDEGP